ncbi:MAG: class I SAM-dependent methyltransferase [Planctomycetes bacterium]|nr:class I SAM-dependent methyltransferase [Planctomycetota bacterium]
MPDAQVPTPATKPPADRPGDALNRLNPPLSQRGAALLRLLRGRIDHVIATYLKKDQGYRLVDYGCGGMPYRPLFEPYASRYIGVDFPANPRAEVHLRPDATVPAPDGIAQIVLSTQVLEHVPNPFAYLKECRRLLVPGGLLILTTHGIYKYHRDPEDLWRWTSPGLVNVLAQMGFRVVSLEGAMGLAPAGAMLLHDALARKTPALLRPALNTVAHAAMLLLDRLHTPAERRKDASVFVVAAIRTP